MPTVSRVTLSQEQVCGKCKGKLTIGDIVVKDKTAKKKTGMTIYYHIRYP
jgi:hypothetical protein